MTGHRTTLLGELLASRYEIRALLGRGGMGEVYEAVDRWLNRTVAVKLLRPELAADRRFLERFRREARTAARLGHPGIVAIHDVGEAEGRAFIVMEFVPGRTLGELMRAEGPMEPGLAAGIAARAADALAHAHERGVVHRDISPGNLMITPAGDVKILDFGIARASEWSARSGSGSARGTTAYVAPEQARGELADGRTDVYALGAVLHELVTGRPPRTDHAGVMAQGALQGELRSIVQRCVADDPTNRFATTQELAEALGRWARTRPASAPAIPARRQDIETTVPIEVVATPRLPERTAELLPELPAELPAQLAPRVARAPRRRLGRAVSALAVTVTVLGAALVVAPTVASLGRGTVPTAEGSPPVPSPTGLAAAASCDGWLSTGIDLEWTARGSSGGYAILRRALGERDFTLVARIGDWRVTSYRDADLGVDTAYEYVVRAVDGPRVSAPTSAVTADTPLLCLT